MNNAETRDPRTPAAWQEAADCAEFLLVLHCAQMYGLVTGGPKPNVDRCEEILKRARDRGIFPAPHDTLLARYWIRGEAEAANAEQ